MDVNIFEEIIENCPKKKVEGLSRKLMKKCSFKSGTDAENLCHLVYWLYIYERPDFVLSLCKPTHEITFDQNFNVWTFIHSIWGLEIRILREKGKEKECLEIIKTMEEHWLTPNKVFNTREKMIPFEERRKERFTYPDITRRDNIEKCLQEKNSNGANTWRFIALLDMIGLGETKLFPNIHLHAKEVENDINEYISILTALK